MTELASRADNYALVTMETCPLCCVVCILLYQIDLSASSVQCLYICNVLHSIIVSIGWSL